MKMQMNTISVTLLLPSLLRHNPDQKEVEFITGFCCTNFSINFSGSYKRNLILGEIVHLPCYLDSARLFLPDLQLTDVARCQMGLKNLCKKTVYIRCAYAVAVLALLTFHCIM